MRYITKETLMLCFCFVCFVFEEAVEAESNDGSCGAGRSWTYQTCIEFGFYQTGSAANQPFSKTVTLDWFVSSSSSPHTTIDSSPFVGSTTRVAFQVFEAVQGHFQHRSVQQGRAAAQH